MDVTAVAEHIAFLSENREALIQKSKAGYAKIAREFDIKKQAAAYFELYKQFKFLKKKRYFVITLMHWIYGKRFLGYPMRVANGIYKRLIQKYKTAP